ncbi:MULTISPECIES: cation:proton antiporter regulatory subunit [Salinibaculum]|uniref:cation:proton antiporter regulatory subunit n=1 Tax=Salinibaculum TaxID=2732368 RepID=UPI0030CCDDF2
MKVYESEVPGVGQKYELELTGDKRLVVVLHHDGRCELFRRDGPDADGQKILDLNGEQANTLGSILEGAFFETVDTQSLSVPLGEDIIEWIDIPDDSPVAGSTLEGCDIRNRTGASVIAVQRGDETVSNPGPDFELAGGDILVAVGTRQEHATLTDVVRGED